MTTLLREIILFVRIKNVLISKYIIHMWITFFTHITLRKQSITTGSTKSIVL